MPHAYKVFLSTEINACVFFNTTFWSMFFPVRKNLVLGAGLFATTSTEEIKGILAHEFGHFSQESMKIGSVVYTANIVLGIWSMAKTLGTDGLTAGADLNGVRSLFSARLHASSPLL